MPHEIDCHQLRVTPQVSNREMTAFQVASNATEIIYPPSNSLEAIGRRGKRLRNMPWPKVRTTSPINRSLAVFLRLIGAAVLLYAGALYESRPAHARHTHPRPTADPPGDPSVDSQPQAPQHAHLELIADPAVSPEPHQILAGILFHLDSGWHIYWQNPGDSGEPPKIQWSLPAGYRAGVIRWPQPTRLGHGSIVDYGYNDQVLLVIPIERTANTQSAPAPSGQIAATVKYLVCQEICIPGKADLTLSLSAATQASTQNSNWHSLFVQAEAELPKKPPASWKISAASDQNDFILTVDTGSVRTRANTSYPAAPRVALFFPATPGQIDNSAPQQFSGTAVAFSLTLHKSDQLTAPISILKGVLVLNGSDSNPGTAYEIAAPVTPAATKGKQ